MPVLQKTDGTADLLAQCDREGRTETYRLTPEGERFLTLVLGLRVGDEFRPSDLELLIERGWALLEMPTQAEPEPEPVPVEVAPPAEVPRPPRAAPTQRAEGGRPARSRRTRAREIALQVLYQTEQNPGMDPEQVGRFVERRLQGDRRLCSFAESLIEGVRAHRPKIDELIAGVAENWRIDRMAAIDRNILRLGAYELLFCPDVPRKVAINEALELAKRYSTAQSSRFVNGILDRLPAPDSLDAPAPDPEATRPAEDAGP